MLICLAQRGDVLCRTTNRNEAKHCRQCGKSLRNAMYVHDPDTLIGSYRVKKVIGHGSFGAVYQAEHVERPAVKVALKETFDPNSIASFAHEFDVLCNYTHDNLPGYYEMFEHRGNGYLVMEFVPGQSLQNILNKQRGSVPTRLVIFYAEQLCDVLEYLHGQNPPIFHRDIKPANIRLTPEGLLKLVDFGLVKQGTDQTRSMIRGFGTPAYEPFEQLGNGTTDQRSDLYSTAATLYHLFTGKRPPTVLERISVATDPLINPGQINPKIPEHISRTIVRTMAPFQKDRPPNVAVFRNMLMGEEEIAPSASLPASQPAQARVVAPATDTSSLLASVSSEVQVALDAISSTQHPGSSSSTLNLPHNVREWRIEARRLNEMFGEPSGYWCYVRPGRYRIGGWEKGEPSHIATLPAFWIARFPLTVSQYVPFIETGGYEASSQAWWTPQGREWKARTARSLPILWDDPAFTTSNQPVIGVSWYEAVAFAAWLNEQMCDELPEGLRVRLPTEAEWEAAEAYNAAMERCHYPWGNDDDPTPEHAVYDRGETGHTASVGTCPAGAAACGAQDMAGNVWEWTTSSYKGYPHESTRMRDDITAGEWDVPVRGGSWWDYRTFMRCGTRDRYRPDFPSHIFGFRLVIAPLVIAPLVT